MAKKQKLSKKERRQRLKDRQREQASKRNEDSTGSGVLDFSQYDEVTYYDLKSKKNAIDILPYIVTSKNHPDGLPKGEEDYKLDVWVHSNVGPKNQKVVCPSETYNKPCPICEDHQQMLDDGEDWKDKKLANIRPKRRCFYNIIDTKEPKKGIQILHISFAWFEKEVYDKAEYKDEAFIAFADLEEGYTITFRGTKDKFEGREFVRPKDFDFEERDAYDEDIYEDVYPLDALLKVHTYDEIEALYYGNVADDQEEEDDDEEGDDEKKSSSKKSKRKSKYKKQQEEEEEEGDDEEGDDDDEYDQEDEEDEDDEYDCPEGHVFGGDHGNTKDCDDCDEETFDLCKKLNKQLKKERKQKKNKSTKSNNKSTRRNKYR